MLDLHWVPGGAAVGGMGLEGGVLGRGEEGGLLAPPHHTHISAAVDALFTRVPQELHKPSLLHKPSRSTPLQTIQPSIQFEVSHAGRSSLISPPSAPLLLPSPPCPFRRSSPPSSLRSLMPAGRWPTRSTRTCRGPSRRREVRAMGTEGMTGVGRLTNHSGPGAHKSNEWEEWFRGKSDESGPDDGFCPPTPCLPLPLSLPTAP